MFKNSDSVLGTGSTVTVDPTPGFGVAGCLTTSGIVVPLAIVGGLCKTSGTDKGSPVGLLKGTDPPCFGKGLGSFGLLVDPDLPVGFPPKAGKASPFPPFPPFPPLIGCKENRLFSGSKKSLNNQPKAGDKILDVSKGIDNDCLMQG